MNKQSRYYCYVCKKSKMGGHPKIKKCNVCYSRLYYINNKERFKQLRDIWYKKNKNYKHRQDKEYNKKKKIKAMKLCGGAKCVNCGCKNIDLLEFNYKKGGHSKLVKNNKLPVGGFLHTKLVNGEVNKNLFDIRCKMCNLLHYLELKYHISYKITYLG